MQRACTLMGSWRFGVDFTGSDYGLLTCGRYETVAVVLPSAAAPNDSRVPGRGHGLECRPPALTSEARQCRQRDLGHL